MSARQIRAVWSVLPVPMRSPEASYATTRTCPPWPRSAPVSCHVRASQSRAVRSTPALAASRPDGANAAPVTRGACLTRPIAAPVDRSTTRARGLPAITIAERPSGLGTSCSTSPGTASWTGLPEALPVTASSRSSDLRATTRTVRPSGANAAAAPSTRCDHRSAPVRRSINRATWPASTTRAFAPERSRSSPISGCPTSMIARSRESFSGWRSASSAPGLGSKLGRLEGERDAELGIRVGDRQRARDELPALRDPRLLARVAPLREGEDGQRGRERETDQGTEREQPQPAMTAPSLGAGALDRSLGVVAAFPAEHGAGQDVVEDLPPPALVGAQDAVTRERGRHRVDLAGRGTGELGEVGCLVRDLGARRRDEVVEQPGRDRPLRRAERLDRPLEVIGHDLSRAAELLERRGPQRRRPRRTLDLPHALHDELEVRRLDAVGAAVSLGDSEAAGAELDPAGTDAVQHALDERVLGDHLLALELAPALQRADDRRPAGRSVEPVEAQDVREQARDVPLEPVEPRERVLAQRQKDVDAQRPVDDRGEPCFEAARRVVIREVLLCLVQDQVHVVAGLRALDRVDQLAGLDLRQVGDGDGERLRGVVAPVREDDDQRRLG